MMKKLKPITVNVEGLISANKYCVDESNRHIELAAEDLTTLPAEEFGKLVRVCPAALYKERADGSRSFDYAGCLECGTCRVLSIDKVVKTWDHPMGGAGVQFSQG